MMKEECLIPRIIKENRRQEKLGRENGCLEQEMEKLKELFNFTKLAEVMNGFL